LEETGMLITDFTGAFTFSSPHPEQFS